MWSYLGCILSTVLIMGQMKLRRKRISTTMARHQLIPLAPPLVRPTPLHYHTQVAVDWHTVQRRQQKGLARKRITAVDAAAAASPVPGKESDTESFRGVDSVGVYASTTAACESRSSATNSQSSTAEELRLRGNATAAAANVLLHRTMTPQLCAIVDSCKSSIARRSSTPLVAVQQKQQTINADNQRVIPVAGVDNVRSLLVAVDINGFLGTYSYKNANADKSYPKRFVVIDIIASQVVYSDCCGGEHNCVAVDFLLPNGIVVGFQACIVRLNDKRTTFRLQH